MGDYLYDPDILQRIDLEKSKVKFSNGISLKNPGDSLVVRPLHMDDYEKGFMHLLSQLSEAGDVSRELFRATFKRLQELKGEYFVTVVEDTSNGKVVASATLEVETKFLHTCANRGRIEDVVVLEEYRGKQLGKILVETLTLLSQYWNCYKTTLECLESNQPFYEKFGYVRANEVYMNIRHKPKESKLL